MFQCDCLCHRTCHLCGKPFVGPNDRHVNCVDTADPVFGTTTGTIYTMPDSLEPWPDKK